MALTEDWRTALTDMANRGIEATGSPHDEGRYHQLLEIAEWPFDDHYDRARVVSAIEGVAKCGLAFTYADDDRDRFVALATFAKALGNGQEFVHATPLIPDPSVPVAPREVGARFVTPKVSVETVVFDADSRVLLVQRADNGTWTLPGGMGDMGSSPVEIAAKEVWEEAGIETRITGLLAVVDGLRHGAADDLVVEWQLTMRGELLGGELRPSPVECVDARWFALDELPPAHQLSRAGQPWVAIIEGALRDPNYQFLDAPRSLEIDLIAGANALEPRSARNT